VTTDLNPPARNSFDAPNADERLDSHVPEPTAARHPYRKHLIVGAIVVVLVAARTWFFTGRSSGQQAANCLPDDWAKAHGVQVDFIDSGYGISTCTALTQDVNKSPDTKIVPMSAAEAQKAWDGYKADEAARASKQQSSGPNSDDAWAALNSSSTTCEPVGYTANDALKEQCTDAKGGHWTKIDGSDGRSSSFGPGWN
jgi:hypothetical protein